MNIIPTNRYTVSVMSRAEERSADSAELVVDEPPESDAIQLVTPANVLLTDGWSARVFEARQDGRQRSRVPAPVLRLTGASLQNRASLDCLRDSPLALAATSKKDGEPRRSAIRFHCSSFGIVRPNVRPLESEAVQEARSTEALRPGCLGPLTGRGGPGDWVHRKKRQSDEATPEASSRAIHFSTFVQPVLLA